MKIEQLYNDIAATYNQKISADVLSKANETAFELTQQQPNAFEQILALGVGDGICLLPYQKIYPEAKLYGLDVSENMLKKAYALLNCETFHGCISESSSLIKKTNLDLILAHFVSAYVPISTTLTECKNMLAPRGIVSIVTNTLGSFSNMLTIMDKLEHSSNPFNQMVQRHVKKALETVYVPQNLDKLEKTFKDQGFEIIETKMIDIHVNLASEKDVFDFFIHGGWFASGMAHPLLPKSLFHRIVKHLIHKHVPIPYIDTLQIAIAIGQKS